MSRIISGQTAHDTCSHEPFVIDCRGRERGRFEEKNGGEERDGAADGIAAQDRVRARRLLMIPYFDILSDIQEAMKKNSDITATYRPSGWPRNSRGSFLSRGCYEVT